MYDGVPTTMPVCVSSTSPARLATRAMPKSATSACPVLQQHVLGLDVAMDDPFAVGKGERIGDALHDPQGLVERQPPLFRQALAQGLPFT